jgi:non-heme chloroperoxidase
MSTFKASDGVEIYPKTGARANLLFSHGWPLDGNMWEAQMLHLSDYGTAPVPLIVVNLLGLASHGGGCNYDTVADDIR